MNRNISDLAMLSLMSAFVGTGNGYCKTSQVRDVNLTIPQHGEHRARGEHIIQERKERKRKQRSRKNKRGY